MTFQPTDSASLLSVPGWIVGDDASGLEVNYGSEPIIRTPLDLFQSQGLAVPSLQCAMVLDVLAGLVQSRHINVICWRQLWGLTRSTQDLDPLVLPMVVQGSVAVTTPCPDWTHWQQMVDTVRLTIPFLQQSAAACGNATLWNNLTSMLQKLTQAIV